MSFTFFYIFFWLVVYLPLWKNMWWKIQFMFQSPPTSFTSTTQKSRQLTLQLYSLPRGVTSRASAPKWRPPVPVGYAPAPHRVVCAANRGTVSVAMQRVNSPKNPRRDPREMKGLAKAWDYRRGKKEKLKMQAWAVHVSKKKARNLAIPVGISLEIHQISQSRRGKPFWWPFFITTWCCTVFLQNMLNYAAPKSISSHLKNLKSRKLQKTYLFPYLPVPIFLLRWSTFGRYIAGHPNCVVCPGAGQLSSNRWNPLREIWIWGSKSFKKQWRLLNVYRRHIILAFEHLFEWLWDLFKLASKWHCSD